MIDHVSDGGFEPLVTAVRVYTTRRRRPPEEPPPARKVKRRYPFEALVFDTETTSDPAQRLLVGVWRMYRDDPDGEPGVTCVEEGLFYPDDLAESDPDGYRVLCDYAAGHDSDAAPGYSSPEAGRLVVLWPVSRWLEDRLHEYGYRHRDRCDLVGFNLLFDLTRLASYWGPGTRSYRGGWSLGFWGSFRGRHKWRDLRYHPRLQARSIDPRRTLFGWGTLKKKDRDKIPTKGRFVDLRTLAFALTDESHSLESACGAFGDPYEKADVEYGRITPELIHYSRQDVEHTATLYRNCLGELRRHKGIPLDASKLFSPATVGTAYLQAMGVAKPVEQFRGISPRTHGWAMSAFFGGRAEARIVRTPVPVAYVDMTSMYPTVSALLDTWPLLTAEHVQRADATREVRALLDDPELADRCLDPGFWADHLGVTLVEIDRPDGVILPVRAEYDEASPDPRIGVNPLRYRGRLWYMLPDLIASTLLGGPQVHIRRAVRLHPRGRQAGLHPVGLRGGPAIDPARQDPFVELIRLRHQIRNDPTIPKTERDRLNLFLKITANATAYGILARFDRRTLANPTRVTVFGPDRPFRSQTRYPEDPGPYCFPPVAATITAAARLMLALLERLVTEAGGVYAFCDTDSMGILCHSTIRHIPAATPAGTNQLPVLKPDQVQKILDRFDRLDPYGSPHIPHLWKPEHDSLKRPLWCYAISAKRYALYRTDPQGRPELLRLIDRAEASDSETTDRRQEEGLADWSEHGLGLYVDPTGPKPLKDKQKRRVWMRQAWEWVLAQAGGTPAPLPDWADRYALTQFSLTGQATANWFTHYNQGRPRPEQIRAGSFGLLAHPAPLTTIRPLGDPDDALQPRLPAAPYDSDPRHWPDLPWYDRGTGQPIRVTTITPHHDPEAFQHAIGRGDVRLSTLGDVLTRFPHQPEHKSLAPNGQPADRRARGLLQRRPVESAPVLTNLIGKEANLLVERATGQTTDPADYQNTHGTRGDRWTELVLPVLHEMGIKEVIARTGRQKSAVYDARAGRSHPTGTEAAPYRQATIDWATERLQEQGERVPRHPDGILYRYLAGK
jgi:hypothetical protein